MNSNKYEIYTLLFEISELKRPLIRVDVGNIKVDMELCYGCTLYSTGSAYYPLGP
jgi:hypothetical protein